MNNSSWYVKFTIGDKSVNKWVKGLESSKILKTYVRHHTLVVISLVMISRVVLARTKKFKSGKGQTMCNRWQVFILNLKNVYEWWHL